MEKKGILVVSFGTSYDETRKKTIDKIENNLKKAFPEYKFYRAWTSKMIIRKLRKSNIHVNTVLEAMDKIVEDNITELIVQPTHILNGVENDIMLNELRKYKDKIPSIKVGYPLLTTTEDIMELINIINKEISLNNDEALVLMGHGTTHYTNPIYAALDYSFKDLGFHNIFVGTVEAYPMLENVIKQLKKTSYKKIKLYPLMIVAGDHATNDMASDEEDSWNTILCKEGYEVKPFIVGIGEFDGISEMFIKHLEKAKRI